MTAITFDTLKYANRLKAGGFSATQAETQAEARYEAFDRGSIWRRPAPAEPNAIDHKSPVIRWCGMASLHNGIDG